MTTTPTGCYTHSDVAATIETGRYASTYHYEPVYMDTQHGQLPLGRRPHAVTVARTDDDGESWQHVARIEHPSGYDTPLRRAAYSAIVCDALERSGEPAAELCGAVHDTTLSASIPVLRCACGASASESREPSHGPHVVRCERTYTAIDTAYDYDPQLDDASLRC